MTHKVRGSSDHRSLGLRVAAEMSPTGQKAMRMLVSGGEPLAHGAQAIVGTRREQVERCAGLRQKAMTEWRRRGVNWAVDSLEA
jgi:hypothetical protein